MNDASMGVGHDLKLDMVRIDDELLDVDSGIPEGFLSFMARAMKASHEARLVVRDTHAATAPAGHRFNHHRITDFLRDLHRFLFVFDYSVAARSNRHAGFARIAPRRVLVPHRVHCLGWRPDEFDLAAIAHFGEVRVLRQKTVTGMNRIDIADLGRAHDAIDF